MATSIDIYLEVGHKRTFACAVDWPGWCRSARDTDGAITALAEYAPRFALVAAQAGFQLGEDPDFSVRERIEGSASTDFGVPSAIAESDARRLNAAQAQRQAAMVEASWAALTTVVASAPAELRKGPRGGGRDRDQIAQHVLAAEAAYARKLGLRHREPALGDTEAIDSLHQEILGALRRARSATPAVAKGWPPRYAARRIAWHAIDHAWEIEDKSG